METKDYPEYVAKIIHRTIVATVDDEGLPVTAAAAYWRKAFLM